MLAALGKGLIAECEFAFCLIGAVGSLRYRIWSRDTLYTSQIWFQFDELEKRKVQTIFVIWRDIEVSRRTDCIELLDMTSCAWCMVEPNCCLPADALVKSSRCPDPRLLSSTYPNRLYITLNIPPHLL